MCLGRNCSEDIDECSPSPCQNNATCENLIAQYKCICDSNHTGMNCEKLVDPCTAMAPCKNSATCLVIPEYNYTCACAEGYAGVHCTDITTLGFDGESSMTISVTQPTNSISFSFQTQSSEGVLVSQSETWVLALVLDTLEVLRTDSPECKIGEPGTFTDSNWHKVELLIHSSSVTVNVSNGIGRVNCGTSRTRRAVSPHSQLVVGADSGATNLPQYVGNIRDFSVNDVKYYPGT